MIVALLAEMGQNVSLVHCFAGVLKAFVVEAHRRADSGQTEFVPSLLSKVRLTFL